jgi:hypothetical protein
VAGRPSIIIIVFIFSSAPFQAVKDLEAFGRKYKIITRYTTLRAIPLNRRVVLHMLYAVCEESYIVKVEKVQVVVGRNAIVSGRRGNR